MARTNLDMDVLRTFATGIELGSFSKAADRLARSQSAVSTQLRKLEQQVGQPLVRKEGRGLALTDAGESLLSYAKRILDLNDEAIAVLQGAKIAGRVRLGLPQDFAEAWLPAVLGRFMRANPRMRVDVRVDRNAVLTEGLLKDELDLALTWGSGDPSRRPELVRDWPVVWIGPSDWSSARFTETEPLPLLAFEPPCIFRSAAIAALDKARIPWRLAFTSPSLTGLWAAAEAGLGITVRSPIGVSPRLAVLNPRKAGLPALPKIGLFLHETESEPSAAIRRLREIIRVAIDEMG
jgi:DNA-binding transcriptional LysR family regulator